MGNLHQARNPCSLDSVSPAVSLFLVPSRSANDGACRRLSETGKELTIWNKPQQTHLFTILWNKSLSIFNNNNFTNGFWFFPRNLGWQCSGLRAIIFTRHLPIIPFLFLFFLKWLKLNPNDEIRIHLEVHFIWKGQVQVSHYFQKLHSDFSVNYSMYVLLTATCITNAEFITKIREICTATETQVKNKMSKITATIRD